jgi:hypothetical protein
MKGTIQRTLSWCLIMAGWLLAWFFFAFPLWVMVVPLSIPLLALAVGLGVAGLAGLRSQVQHFWSLVAAQLVVGWVVGIVLGQIFTPDFRWIN